MTDRIEPTAEEKQAVYEEILRRNNLRRQNSMPGLDIGEQYVQELNLIRQKRYRELLKPYLKKVVLEKPQGAIHAMKLNAIREAEAAKMLFEDAGIHPPHPPKNTVFRLGSDWHTD